MPTPQNGQTYSNNSSPRADELFECVWPFCRCGPERDKQLLGVFSYRTTLKITGNKNIGGAERVKTTSHFCKVAVNTMWLYWDRIPKWLVVVLFLKSSMQSFQRFGIQDSKLLIKLQSCKKCTFKINMVNSKCIQCISLVFLSVTLYMQFLSELGPNLKRSSTLLNICTEVMPCGCT